MSESTTCQNCGARLTEGANICTSCGKTLNSAGNPPPSLPQPPPLPVTPPFIQTQPPPVPPTQPPPVKEEPEAKAAAVPPAIPPAAVTSERVVSVVGMVTRKTGVFSSELYHLVITDKRLIFALQTHENQVSDVKQAREQAKKEGKNLLGQIGAQIATRSGDKYMNGTPELIMAENAKNFAIDLDHIVKISVFHGDFDDNAPDSLEIKTITQKLKFTISNAYAVQKQLKSILGSKVH